MPAIKMYSAAQMYIGTAVPVYPSSQSTVIDMRPERKKGKEVDRLTPATVAITALKMPIILFHPIAIPFPVPR
jgi:hypothetical protein